jgi:hypothetical protein
MTVNQRMSCRVILQPLAQSLHVSRERAGGRRIETVAGNVRHAGETCASALTHDRALLGLEGWENIISIIHL